MKKILIVDDDSRNIFALSAVLRSRGFECIAASGMEDAWQIMGDGKGIGVLLLDMMMPDMDGYEIIPQLRANEQFHKIPVIAVTAQAMAGDREKCLAAGADDYLAKPVNVDLLDEMIKKYLHEAP